MLHPSTIQLLRFHFSLFLLPVFLFALSQVPAIDWYNACVIFFILHLLVYPSSNGYNSYMDKDETPIGGLARPMQPTKQLLYVTIIMDVTALALAFAISFIFAMGILFYIIASRAYSYRGIRLKRLPVIGFLTVFFFQGAVIFFITYHGANVEPTIAVPIFPCIAASLLIGASYPLTQIYQHQQDKADGVITLSYVLGKKGTFIFSLCLFSLATALLYFIFFEQNKENLFYLFLLCMVPVVLFFTYWMYKVWKNEEAANFKNSLWMNIISTLSMIICFATFILINQF